MKWDMQFIAKEQELNNIGQTKHKMLENLAPIPNVKLKTRTWNFSLVKAALESVLSFTWSDQWTEWNTHDPEKTSHATNNPKQNPCRKPNVNGVPKKPAVEMTQGIQSLTVR